MDKVENSAAVDTSKHAGELITDDAFLTSVRQQMLGFATLQLGDSSLAEDAVQEALVGAFKNASSFAGRAAFKTWVFAILKNKIFDILRKKKRLNETELLESDESDATDGLPSLFDESGHWHKKEAPVAWGNPEADMENNHFWRVFDTCLNHLPARQARVFMMREFIDLDSGTICSTVGITETNLNVLLYRARLRLRECLENNWFAKGAGHA